VFPRCRNWTFKYGLHEFQASTTKIQPDTRTMLQVSRTWNADGIDYEADTPKVSAIVLHLICVRIPASSKGLMQYHKTVHNQNINRYLTMEQYNIPSRFPTFIWNSTNNVWQLRRLNIVWGINVQCWTPIHSLRHPVSSWETNMWTKISTCCLKHLHAVWDNCILSDTPPIST
jgi:hypothetical protein